MNHPRLVSFLVALIRHHMPAAEVERAAQASIDLPVDLSTLKPWAESWAEILTEDATIDDTAESPVDVVEEARRLRIAVSFYYQGENDIAPRARLAKPLDDEMNAGFKAFDLTRPDDDNFRQFLYARMRAPRLEPMPPRDSGAGERMEIVQWLRDGAGLDSPDAAVLNKLADQIERRD